ncbi:MAG: hypothetical protein WBP85_00100 [Terracidiphilus sp.]
MRKEDMQWQHEREAQGRPTDPSGYEGRQWREEVSDALEARLEHLGALPGELERLSALHASSALPLPAAGSRDKLTVLVP